MRSHTLVCSGESTHCINNDGNVISVGYSDCGAHGHDEDLVFPLKMIPTLNHIVSIDISLYHSICLDIDGNVFTFGKNDFGQLGIGSDFSTVPYTHFPQKITLPPCVQVACGDFFSFCLSDNGQLYSFGCNERGELGIGNNTQWMCNSPQLVESLKDVEFIECGGFHSFCKTNNNEIFCWGDNVLGQLGLKNTFQHSPILCSSLSHENVIDIKCGNEHSIVLTSNGDVLSCGGNKYNQLGREINGNSSDLFQKVEVLSEITRIECGDNHSICIDASNHLYFFGVNGSGQMGLGETKNGNMPIKHPSLSNIIDISKGGSSTFVKTSNNEIYAFGKNYSSQLGIKTEDNKNLLTPIRVFENNEDIWFSNINKSKSKSARN